MTHPLAALLKDVPRYSLTQLGPVEGGQWLNIVDILSALEAAPPMGVKVKPLEWEAGERDQRRADSILGEFCVTFFGGRWFYQGEPRKGMLDAQAAAQADYEARILAALEAVQPPNLVEALKGARETILHLINQRWSEVEGTDSEWTAEIDAAITLCQAQAAQIAGLEKEGAALASWQCVFTDGKTGLVGDEYGNQFCQMQRRAEAAEAERDNLSDKLERERALTDGAHRRARAAEAKVAELEAQIAGLEGGIEAACRREAATERKLRAEAATLRDEVERLRGALELIESMTVHSGGEIHGVTMEHYRTAVEAMRQEASIALDEIGYGVSRAALEGKTNG